MNHYDTADMPNAVGGPRLHVGRPLLHFGGGQTNTHHHEVHLMQVLNNSTNGNDTTPLRTVELKAMAQFKARDRGGTALWRPGVTGNVPSPDCVTLIHKIGRFAICFLSGDYDVEDGSWYHRADDGEVVSVEDPLESAWQAAMAVRDDIIRDFDFGAFVLPVAVFADMEPDETVLDMKGDRGVKVLWGLDDLVERVIRQLPKSKWRSNLNAQYVDRDLRVLSTNPVPYDPDSPDDVEVDLGSGVLNIHGPSSVVVNVASGAEVIINVKVLSEEGEAPPGFTVREQ